MLTEKPRIPIRSILLYGLWPNFIKVLLYRLKGYRIGKGVRIGLGAVICGDHVDVGDHTSIGFLTIIRGKNIRLGSYVQIGSLTFLDTPYVEIGEGTNINEQVFVGGLQFPDSRLVVGRNCSIMQFSFINPAPSIVIGDECVIGGHCLIFGHSSSLNQFEGYGVEFAPIEIGRGVGLAWRTFVLPGTKIGDGTMVGANSVVSGTLPPCSMAVGYPARIVGRPPTFPKKVSDEEKVVIFRDIIAAMIEVLTKSGFDCQGDNGCYEITQSNSGWRKAKKWRMQVADNDVGAGVKISEKAPLDLFLSLKELPHDVRKLLSSQRIMWIDVSTKEQSRITNALGEEAVAFLRRYGVRLQRFPRTSPVPIPNEMPSGLFWAASAGDDRRSADGSSFGAKY